MLKQNLVLVPKLGNVAVTNVDPIEVPAHPNCIMMLRLVRS